MTNATPIEMCDSTTGDPARVAEYRRRGWWTGERLTDRFRRFVEEDPKRLSVVDDNGTALSRSELWSRATETADLLAARGVGAGEVVLVYMPNSVDWQVVFLAILQLGAIPATIPVSTDSETLTNVYHRIGARAIVAADAYRGHPTGEWALRAAATSGNAGVLVVYGAGGTVTYTEIVGEAAGPIVPAGIDHLMFTSSTTGMPKAVMHTSDTLAAVNIDFAERFGIDEDTPIFMPSPMGHSVGAWHGARFSLFTGAPLVVQNTWDPVRALELVDEHHCVFTAAATPFLKDLVDAPWPDGRTKLASMRSFLCGGAPVPPSLLEAAQDQAPDTFVTVLWGMTEGTGTTCVPDSTDEQLTGTAGKPVPNLELDIVDTDSSGVGELVMRGAGAFVGYLGQEDLYRSLLIEGGWFRTGDLARIDDEGYLHLTGRLKDLIIRGGVNISPLPIEDLIAAHPAVRRVAVIGRTDDRLGERICAVIVPAGAPPTLDELSEWLKIQGLSARQLPESLEVVDEMPVTAAGKIRKVELRRLIEETA
ncbi:AMP-binding protein [Rhodococcus sp. SJ-2]